MRVSDCARSWRVYIVVVQLLCLAVGQNTSQQLAESLPYNSKTYTPLSSPEECARTCREEEGPRTCYYHFTLEHYVVLGAACLDSSTRAQCVQADGVERTFLAVNRMLPGPSIQVCEGDKVVIDVFNKIQGEEVTIHWHGIQQRGTQYYDGMPFVTQCPIHQGNTFRYQWYANPGTHFWHSHSGLQKLDGLHGSLIVRQTRTRELQIAYFDYDIPAHVIEISDWMHESASAVFPGLYTNTTGGRTDQDPANILINGLGRFTDPITGRTTNTSYADFVMRRGTKYRFRVIASLATVCQVQLTIANHTMRVIAMDGEPMQPVYVDSIVMSSGERFDIVVNANQSVGAYWIQVRGLGECAARRTQQFAILRYQGAPRTPSSSPPTYDPGLPQGVILNPLFSTCDGSNPNRICVSEVQNRHNVDPGILQQEADVKIFIPYRFMLFTPQQLFTRRVYTTFLVNDQFLLNSVLAEITYSSPPSPLLSQPWSIPPDQVCNDDNRPARCSNRSQSCACTHLLEVPLNAVVEIVLMDTVSVPELSHPFHLHGYAFHVVQMGTFPNTNITMKEMQAVLNRNRTELLQRQSNRPPGKDTVTVPNNGYAIIRFRADNPGFWFFHCHFLYHIVIGMNLVLQVGTYRDVPPVPPQFPKCGNYLPPIDAPYSEYN